MPSLKHDSTIALGMIGVATTIALFGSPEVFSSELKLLCRYNPLWLVLVLILVAPKTYARVREPLTLVIHLAFSAFETIGQPGSRVPYPALFLLRLSGLNYVKAAVFHTTPTMTAVRVLLRTAQVLYRTGPKAFGIVGPTKFALLLLAHCVIGIAGPVCLRVWSSSAPRASGDAGARSSSSLGPEEWADSVAGGAGKSCKDGSTYVRRVKMLRGKGIKVQGIHLSDLTEEEVQAARALIAAQTSAGAARCLVSMCEGCVQISLEMYSLMRQEDEAESQPEDLTWVQLSDGDIIRCIPSHLRAKATISARCDIPDKVLRCPSIESAGCLAVSSTAATAPRLDLEVMGLSAQHDTGAWEPAVSASYVAPWGRDVCANTALDVSDGWEWAGGALQGSTGRMAVALPPVLPPSSFLKKGRTPTNSTSDLSSRRSTGPSSSLAAGSAASAASADHLCPTGSVGALRVILKRRVAEGRAESLSGTTFATPTLFVPLLPAHLLDELASLPGAEDLSYDLGFLLSCLTSEIKAQASASDLASLAEGLASHLARHVGRAPRLESWARTCLLPCAEGRVGIDALAGSANRLPACNRLTLRFEDPALEAAFQQYSAVVLGIRPIAAMFAIYIFSPGYYGWSFFNHPWRVVNLVATLAVAGTFVLNRPLYNKHHSNLLAGLSLSAGLFYAWAHTVGIEPVPTDNVWIISATFWTFGFIYFMYIRPVFRQQALVSVASATCHVVCVSLNGFYGKSLGDDISGLAFRLSCYVLAVALSYWLERGERASFVSSSLN